MIQLGALFPQTDIGTDPQGVREYAQAVEAMGCTHLLAYDHVIGANIDRPDRAGRRWPYTYKSVFHEPFVLFAHLAAITQRLSFATGVIILPQRQTVLVAKQAAALDVLSGGRLRLGVGLGWNTVEYEALNESFENRSQRFVEQLEVMRRLWTEELVTYEGRWHRISDAGLNPLPVQRPIPLWIGGAQAAQMEERDVQRIMRRIGRWADGWMLTGRPSEEVARRMQLVREYAEKAGRDPASIGLEGAIPFGDGDPDAWKADLAQWQAMGATHITLQPRGANAQTPAEHADALRRMMDVLRSEA